MGDSNIIENSFEYNVDNKIHFHLKQEEIEN